MDFDLPGRIRNTRLPHSHALLPLFEAVINSIDATDESRGRAASTITVYVERDHSQEFLPVPAATPFEQPVRSFTIRDNGIGFTNLNYKSFCTADSRKKANRGGKGIGRFLWLKAFDHAEIVSTFREEDGKRYTRTFTLRLSPAGVEDHSLVEASADVELGTSVRLVDYKPEYREGVPHSAGTIARRIVEHCLENFVLGLTPSIYVHDVDSEEIYDLSQIFENEVNVTTTVGNFSIAEHRFTIHNLRVSPSYEGTHRLHYCANNRAVVSENLIGKIPNMVGSLKAEDGRPFMYAGYVSGLYLDDTVNSERTDFTMPADDSLPLGISWRSVVKNSTDQAASFVGPYTTSIKNAKDQQIATYVRDKAPQYRPVVKHRKELLDTIPPGLSEEKLDVELYKINQMYEAELRHESSEMLSTLETGPQDWESFKKKYAKFPEEWNESGIAKLARHIAHRKATIEFLKASLKANALGRYQLESAIHQLIFPLKKTSDDVRPIR